LAATGLVTGLTALGVTTFGVVVLTVVHVVFPAVLDFDVSVIFVFGNNIKDFFVSYASSIRVFKNFANICLLLYFRGIKFDIY
jgi:hypothetical protein